MRSLRSPEGQRLVIPLTGSITRVDAAIWRTGETGEVEVVIYRRLGDRLERLLIVSTPNTSLPEYKGIRSEYRVTHFRVDPPIEVVKADEIHILFHATADMAVSGISMRDPVANSSFIGLQLPSEAASWDFVLRLCLE